MVGIVVRTITFRHPDGVSRQSSTSQVEAMKVFRPSANPRAVTSRRLEAPAGTELVVPTASPKP